MLECKTAPFAPIAAGDKLPDGELTYLDDDGKLQKHMMYDLARDKKVVIFGVPGAFTPTCRYLTLPLFSRSHSSSCAEVETDCGKHA